MQKFNKRELFRLGSKQFEEGSFWNYVPFFKVIAQFLDKVLNPYDNPLRSAASNGHYPNGASLHSILHFG